VGKKSKTKKKVGKESKEERKTEDRKKGHPLYTG
jgi:hypothetical protein